MNSNYVNEIFNEAIEYKDTQKENKIKIVNDLVKNFCLLKELNLLDAIKNEEKVVPNIKLDITSYDSKNIIYANKYIVDFLQLKKQNKLKLKEEKKRKKEKYEEILNEKDVMNITNTLNENELNLSVYEKNIKNYNELNNFQTINNSLFIKYIDMPTINHNSFHIKFLQLLNLLIKNYNASLNLIKTQKNVMNYFSFYTENLLMNNKKLIEKNRKLLRNNSINMELRSKLTVNNCTEIKLPFTNQDNLSSLFQIQIDLYRKHINNLYNQIDDLKKFLNIFNVQDLSSNN
ncbi:conserved Plasmodium protein, unknown function [Plasmodium gallinaceum]|uniref:Uncharacterized protein n=1 Tax=Plasmodium gallinaceum TaxID=5849 RepID=A0A1J1GR31_PLAGA|nr:conserved Plasmodium protein, unknown function [Plasmodium gallinaceum]CRG94999.1 conserved Plasmodium protein, unknown function [Plasmodium gallinaceum]